jgi:NAD(P)-dependent dehydrogenase (short-subunit alcohol dehydrogenase family)
VESHLHALLGRCVVHLHPVAVGAYVCAKRGREALEALFAGDDPPPVWVPYTNPGYLLARKVSRVIDSYRRRYGAAPRVMFLQKHGLLVTAEEPEEVLALVRRVIETCSAGLPPRGAVRPAAPAAQDITAAQRAVRRAVWEATGQHTAVRQFLDDDLAWFLAHPEAARLASLPPLTPDELAYGGNSALWVDQADASAIARRLKRQMARGERPSASFLMKDVGLLVSGTDRTIPIIRDVVTAALLVRGYATAAGGPNPLTKAQRAFVARWEGERYRRELATGAQEGELCGYIALVTGAGSGLGRSIAIGLGRAGALVALVDIDVAGAEQTRDLIAREAARIMIEQGMGGSIINLSSKSGLQASRDNTAYNATKAAEIHMARGWALELGEHGIRVNSVAPGNVFEGSKIWNEEYIRACARKYGIRPEQVIPYYINMTALKRDIKGQDVADAVVFLCSERARTITGQTLVPDGGQVMVR